MEKNRPIGIFDSGVGGLTVVKSLVEQLPRESFIYFGDTAHVPYGSKSEQQLFSYAHNIISFLLEHQVKAIIVACGTTSSVTLPLISQQYEVPMLGVVKAGARSAARQTRNGKIGVAATLATVNKLAYTAQIKAIDDKYEVFETACPRFVPLVEAGKLAGEENREAVKEYMEPLLQKGIDTLVLGCTHYPFLSAVIRDYIGDGVHLVDPSCDTIEELKGIFNEQQLFRDNAQSPTRKFYVSGNDESFYSVGKLLIGEMIQEVNWINLD